MLTSEELTGRAQTHIEQWDLPNGRYLRAQADAGRAFLALAQAARDEGIELEAVSTHRTFAAQCHIWNSKYRGDRTLYDAQGAELDYAKLSESARIDAILAWSALPGASRHHWGCEFDVIDRAAISEGYRVNLLPEEFAPEGVFAHLAQWLHAHAGDFGFFWPYDQERGGFHVEPWHLSFAPVSALLLPKMTKALIIDTLNAPDQETVLGRVLVMEKLDDIVEKQIKLVGVPSAEALRAKNLA